MKVVTALKLRELAYIPVDEVADVSLEEARSARLVSQHGLRESATREALEIALSGLCRLDEPRLVLEDAVDEVLVGLLDLPSGERPKLDRLHATDERVGKPPKPEDARRACQEEAPRPRVIIHLSLDGQEKVRSALNLIYR